MVHSREIYDMLIERAKTSATVQEIFIGMTWTLCQLEGNNRNKNIGLAMSPAVGTRTLPWSGTLKGKSASDLAPWLLAWEPFQATVGMAVVNAVINSQSELLQQASQIDYQGPANLAVFEHFLPCIRDKRVIVIGRYPGLECYESQMKLNVVERMPGPNDYPDPAVEYLLPEAEWVFLTASSITNKTFPRLSELAKDAHLVLMGPTVPWISDLAEFGVDFIAGVKVGDSDILRNTVAEGGGVRIFESGVRYCVADLRGEEMQRIKSSISEVVGRREQLKRDMEAWYAGPWRGSFPRVFELETIDKELSSLDTRYKRLWDARQPHMN